MSHFEWAIIIGLGGISALLYLCLQLLGRVVTGLALAARPTDGRGNDSVVEGIDRLEAKLELMDMRLLDLYTARGQADE